MKKKFVPLVFLFTIFLAMAAAKCFNHWPGILRQSQACFKNNCFYVELADTAEKRNRGLMFKKQLDPDRGMLFIYEKEGEYLFWMENILIPLDIIWINKDKEVVFISESCRPCEKDTCFPINPGKNANYVLEINGGMAEKIGLAVGDKFFVKEAVFLVEVLTFL